MTALKKGFTLIELLIVIAILGTLAVVVLLAINPVQQLARTRDSGRVSGVTQLGHALEAYAVTHSGRYPLTSGRHPITNSVCNPANWIGCLVEAGEITTTPGEITQGTGLSQCTRNAVNGWCYDLSGTDAIVFARLESDSMRSKCTSATQSAWAVYATEAGRGGVVCTSGSEPTAASFDPSQFRD